MKAITHDLSASGNDVKIVPLADLHIGDSQSDMKLIKNMLDAILNLPDTYCILGGDLMDSAIASWRYIRCEVAAHGAAGEVR